MNFNLNKRVAFIAATDRKPPLSKGWLFVILVALFTPHWIEFYHTAENTIAPDLLLRTIGSRLQEAGKQIYQHQWQPGDPVAWLNPYPDTREGLNGVVSTPFLLWLLQPFSRLDYCTIKVFWGTFQQGLFFASAWFCCTTFFSRLRQCLFIGMMAFFFIYSRNWLLNIYNGQIYIFYAFTFSVSGYIITRYKTRISSVVLFVVLSSIRPFFITSIIPIFKFKPRYFFYLIASALIVIALIATTTSTGEWVQYNNAMKVYSKEQTGELVMDTTSSRLYSTIVDPCTINANALFTAFGAGCLYSLQHYLKRFGISVSNVNAYKAVLTILLLFIWWFAYKKKWLHEVSKQLLLSFIFYQLCELITPASRNPYNMIQWLPAVAWLFIWGNKKVLILLLIGLCLNHDVPFRFPYAREIGEMTMFSAVVLFLLRQKNRLIRN